MTKEFNLGGIIEVCENKMKLKTLKDLERKWDKNMSITGSVDREKLKAEAIKWVKEDKDLEIDQERTMVVALKSILIERWMKRFNITEDDLE